MREILLLKKQLGKKLNDLEVEEQIRLKVSKMFSAVENLDGSVDISSVCVCGCIRWNFKL